MEHEEEAESNEPLETSNKAESENIEVIDVEVNEETGARKKQKYPIPATPMFHGGETRLIIRKP